jgi:hypothetical protein
MKIESKEIRMALTVSEANAVSVVVERLAGIEDGGNGVPDVEQFREGLRLLVAGADKRLSAGVSPERFDSDVWPKIEARLAPLPAGASTEVQTGVWYPYPAPVPEAAWFDHKRCRNCLRSWHVGCADEAGEICKCPCRRDEMMAEASAGLTAELEDIPRMLLEFYGLPEATAYNVGWLGVMAWRETAGGDGYEAAVRKKLTERYPPSATIDGFVTDVVCIVRHIASRSPVPAGGA